MPERVFITGASSGIGAALADAYASRGATLGLVARRRAELEALTARLSVPAAVYPIDVSDTAALQRAGADFIAAHGVPDVVIANAGISVGTLGASAEDVPVVDRIFRVNVIGLAATLQPFVEPMRSRGSGALVGIASVAGFRGLPGAGAYSASKAAAISWLESLRVELHGSGVAVVTICPGYIDTPMTRVNRYPMPFLLPVDEAARRFVRAIDARRSRAVIPWQMGIAGGVLRALPNWLYDRLFARAPHKRRDLPS